MMLLKSGKRKIPAKSDANRRWQFSPSLEEKRHKSTLERENQSPTPGMLLKLPLLRQ
jgi:hypothetical protein